MNFNVRKLTLHYTKVPISLSELLLLIYISSVIIVSMIPVGNIVSQIIGILLTTYFIIFQVIPGKKQILIGQEFKYFLGFILICYISGYIAADIKLVTIKIITLLQLLVLFTIGYSIILQSKLKMEYYYYTIIISVLFVIIFGMFAHISDPVVTRNRLTSTAGDPNFLAVLGAFAATFTAGLFLSTESKLQKFLLFFIFSILLVGVVRTQSRQGILLILFNLLILIVINYSKKIFTKKNKKQILYLLFSMAIVFSVFIVIFIVYRNTDYFIRIQLLVSYIKLTFSSSNVSNMILTADTSIFERKQLILNGIKMWIDHPIFGVGLDNFRITIREYWPISRKLYSHNNYIELLSTIGTFGMITFYIVYWSIFQKIMKLRSKIQSNQRLSTLSNMLLVMILGLLFMDLFTVTYYVKFVWIFFFLILGYVDRYEKNSANGLHRISSINPGS